MLLLRSFVATGTGNSAGLVEKSSDRCTGNVVVTASSSVEAVVIVVVVSSVWSGGLRKKNLKEDSQSNDTLIY